MSMSTTTMQTTGDPLLVEGLNVSLSTSAGVISPVQEASLSVAGGEKVALVGETGCGKSVLLRSIVRLIPDKLLAGMSGSVAIAGREVIGAPAKALSKARREDVGVVFQDASTYLNPTMSIGAQVAETLRIRGKKRYAEVADILASVGLPNTVEYMHRYPHELSGGMRQRVMIAIALARRPRLLLADEPTTALDVTVQAGILRQLDELVSSSGMGLLLVTHDLGVVAELCDRMYVMYAGQIVEQGPVDEVFRNPRHPYTIRLMECALSVDGSTELRSIPGSVPSPAAFPTGCRFRERCHRAMDICGEEPAMLVDDDRAVKCLSLIHI